MAKDFEAKQFFSAPKRPPLVFDAAAERQPVALSTWLMGASFDHAEVQLDEKLWQGGDVHKRRMVVGTLRSFQMES